MTVEPWSSQTPMVRLLEGLGQGSCCLFCVPLRLWVWRKDGALAGSTHYFC